MPPKLISVCLNNRYEPAFLLKRAYFILSDKVQTTSNRKTMRILSVLIFSLISACAFSQTLEFDSLLQEGKAEFRKDFEKQDFKNAVDKLERAVKLKPDNAEAHYFLGYAYSRLNSKDGKAMTAMNLPLTLKTSEQFELVNKLTPKYEGEFVVLDPYSKLTSEWGSLAMSYWHNNKTDSALWAFAEGKRRGGFGEFFLSVNRKALDFCSENAILISSGDNNTIPLWYLQIVENYRTDVTVIDISLLNTQWYPKYLKNNSDLTFGLSDSELDSIQYIPWSDSLISIHTPENTPFSWTLKASYYDRYLLRGDRLFLNILTNNKFKREVFFTKGFIEDYRLSLKNHLNSLILIDRLNYNQKPKLTYKEYTSKLSTVLVCLNEINTNSRQEVSFPDNIRFVVFTRIHDCLKTGDKKQAEKLMAIIDKDISPTDYPFQSDGVLEYYEYLKAQL
jgi:hypothetical protein